LGEEIIRNVLKNLELTEKEAEVYVFLSKHGVLKCNEIAKGMKRHKAQIYRILKILQTKGLLESTLEAPARFTAVPFETVLDLSIKAKRDEAAQMETTKSEILTYWKSIHQPGLEPPIGKFVVIEGDNKIYARIAQMIKDTKRSLSVVATVPGLARADQFGLFDNILSHPLKSKIQIRFVTDLSNENLPTIKTLLKESHFREFNLKGRNPELGLQAPRMVLGDNDEILFFITPKLSTTSNKQDVCLWTDCEELALAFSAVFEDLWRNSTDIEQNIAEIERGSPSQRIFINNAEEAEKTYYEIVSSAKKQILVLTSSQGLATLCENTALIEAWIKRGISVKIMAPITSGNFKAALQLAKYCPTRHIPSGYLQTTVVDETHLFQFHAPRDSERMGASPQFEDVFYTSDGEHVGRITLMLKSLWNGAPIPSAICIDSLSSLQPEIGTPETLTAYAKATKDVPDKDLPRSRSTAGKVLIQAPSNLGIPATKIIAVHYEKESTYGEGNSLYIKMRLKTPNGYEFVPVATVETNEKAVVPQKAMSLGTPAANNFQFVKTDELQIRKNGNTLFVGWTGHIPLPPTAHILPSACMLFEAYGKPQHVMNSSPLGDFIENYEYDRLDAFVTFLDPSWKNLAPGTHGVMLTNVVGSITRPK
jgi:sugar-specific transcriptional regulator TrmB